MIKNNGVKYFQVAQNVWGMKLGFVNIYMIANRSNYKNGWVLVDTGTKGSAEKIIAMAEALFGFATQPLAVVLTHGHSDHAGSVEELLKHWDVPVYAHQLEVPYLTGVSSYPPPDPLVGGGMSLLSVFFPKERININGKLKIIDIHEGIPELPEWKVIHTPGHSPGHISLFFKLNTTLIAGDAFATTKAESAIYVLGGIKKLSGPPKFYTTNWVQAAESVRKLADLEPRIAATGHGPVMRGRELQISLRYLADHFEQQAIPGEGRYVDEPAIAGESGTVYVPPFKVGTKIKLGIVIIGVIGGILIANIIQKKRND